VIPPWGSLLLILALPASGCRPKAPSQTRPLLVLGKLGNGAGEFFFPRSAAVNERGELSVVDRSGRIQKFKADGSLALTILLPEHEKGQPTGINYDSRGDLLVADSHYQRILVYGPPLSDPPSLLRKWGREGSGPGEFSLIRDIVEDSHGFLYAGDYNGPEDRIQKLTPSGEFVLAWGKRGSARGEFQRPQGLSVERREDGREFILVADSCNHRVQRFTTTGEFAGAFGGLGSRPGEMKYPYGVAATPPGAPGGPAIYVAEWGNNRVQRFNLDGTPVATWGRPGHGEGELATPWDVAVGSDGRIFVVDFGNHRVQVLSPGAIGGRSLSQ